MTKGTYVARKKILTTEEQRRTILEQTGYNAFNFPAMFTVVDYLSESGSSAMFDSQVLFPLSHLNFSYSFHNAEMSKMSCSGQPLCMVMNHTVCFSNFFDRKKKSFLT